MISTMATLYPEGLWKPPNLKTHKGLTLEDVQKKPENDLKVAWPPLCGTLRLFNLRHMAGLQGVYLNNTLIADVKMEKQECSNIGIMRPFFLTQDHDQRVVGPVVVWNPSNCFHAQAFVKPYCHTVL